MPSPDLTIQVPNLQLSLGTKFQYAPLPAPTVMVDGTFKGGGSLGSAYVGALMAMADSGVWFQRVAGTSAGAILSAIIAAGYDANEIDFLYAPDMMKRPKPSNFPGSLGANMINYANFLDFPRNANDVSVATKRSSILYNVVKGQALDTVGQIQVNLPSATALADQILSAVLSKLPTQVGPWSVSLGGSTLSTGWPHPYDKVSIPGGSAQAGPYGLTITAAQNTAIRDAILKVLGSYPTQMKVADLGIPTAEPARTAFADTVVDAALNVVPFYAAYLNFLGDGGLFKGDAFLAIMRKVIEAKVPGGHSPVLFQHLPMDLTIIASDTGNKKMIVYSKQTTPNFEVAEAVRQSMSIPMIFEPRKGSDGSEIMDGGMIDNFPFWVHLINQSPADMARPKLAFRLNSDVEAPSGCPDSSHRDLNIAANKSGEFLEGIVGLSGPAPQTTSNLAEFKALERSSNIHATQQLINDSAHLYLLDAMSKLPGVQLYLVEVGLKGFFWLDFAMDTSTFNGMACRGWEATMNLLKQKNVVPSANLAKTDIYR